MRHFVKDILKMYGEMDDMFNWMTTVTTRNDVSNSWKTCKTDEGLKLVMDLPGYGREDVEVDITDYLMTVEGEIPEREFKNVFKIPKNTDIDKIDASMKHGVLTIMLPMIRDKSKSTKIPID